MKLNSKQHDRAAGAIVGTAVGDALGAGYEFARIDPDEPIQMIGGGLGNFDPAEWTDDTSMALMILEVTARGVSLSSGEGLDMVAENFVRWYDSRPPDIGITTSAVLSGRDRSAKDMTKRAARMLARGERTGGNGSLMRTAPVALATLDSAERCFIAAKKVSDLTHSDPRAAEACQLWSYAIRHAVLHGTYEGVFLAVKQFDDEVRRYWENMLVTAQNGSPKDFPNNGWVVHALQTAWWAITNATGQGHERVENALELCVRAGGDTDTTAAIAGGLLGAVHGVSAIKAEWRRHLHGWPHNTAKDLVRLAYLTTSRGENGPRGWPDLGPGEHPNYRECMTEKQTRHPHDPGLILGGYETIHSDVDVVISLCRSGDADNAHEHIEFWLVDDGPKNNTNLGFVIEDAARTILQLRQEGKTVALHCVQGASRTPSVAARYSVLLGENPYAVLKAMKWADPNKQLWRAAVKGMTAISAS